MSKHDNGTDMRRSPLVGRQSTEKSEEKRDKQTDGQTEITTHPHPPASVEILFKLNQTNSDGFSVVLKMMSDVLRSSVDVLRSSLVFYRCFQRISIAHRCSLDRCVQDMFQ